MNSVATLPELTLAQRRELLKMARARDLVGDRSELPPIERVPRHERLPLSFAQQGLWFVEQLGSLGATYHLPLRLRLRGELHRDALARALDGIVARHEALRTVFTQVDGIPEQRIAPAEASGFHLAETDLAGRPDAEPELGRWMAEEARAPFDLQRGPPIRGRLIRLAADDHVLLLTMHHIVSDGWSLRVLLAELAARYAAHHAGGEAELAELPVQYADYSAWQRRWVEGEVLREQADYWTRTLGGAPELLELPTDRPRPAQVDHAGATLRVELDETLTAGIKALARRHGTTLFMTLLAGWAAVLSRLSGQDDVVVGTPTAGRGRPEIEGLIGFFVNMLALRVDLSGSPTVAELLARVKERALAAQRHQDIPFDQVVELVDPARSLSHSPLFQVVFAWVNAPLGAGISLPGLEVDAVATGASQAKFDLSLTMQEAGGRIAGVVEYATALFDRATVERYLGYLRRVLQAMVEDERQPVDRLPLLSPAERWQVVEGWNATEAEVPADRCIHELFEAQAARTPDAVAVRFEEESLTYAELDARANRLAHHLRGRGVGPEVRVGVLVERSPALIAAVLGVLKAGGAYVPLDSTYPAERLRYVLEDSGARVLVTGGGAEAALAGEEVDGFAVVDLDAEAEAIAREPETPPASGVHPQNLAYVIHTSGSTGRPKGTGVPHGSLVSSTRARTVWYGADPRHFLLLSSMAFDSSVAGVFWTLCGGGALHLMSAQAQAEPAEVVRQIREGEITDLLCVPSYYAALLRFVREPLPSLARAIVAGEAATWDLAAQHRALLPHAALVNEYGPTEATVWSTAYLCSADADAAAAVIPIGGPIPNARAYVVDGHGHPVPVGVAGELWVGGAGVTRGYLGRPGLTAERFVPDPFSGKAGARLYRTGDRVRWRADGVIDFLGRLDHQVKVRGFRIELGEIEAVLRRYESVTDCVVVAREDVPGDRRLVAYIVGEAEADALRAHLRRSVPDYMVPSAFVTLEALPLTPNGKLDRKALPAPDFVSAEERYVAPRTPVEEVLAGIWAEVLRLDRVGVEEDFFDLGGHSLLATRVVSRIREVFRVDLPLRALFAGPTVAELGGRVEELRRAWLPVLPPVVPVDRDRPLPLSFAQERLWFLDRLEPGSAVYNIPAAWRLGGVLDPAALERALGEIVRRHEALRTTFGEVDGSPVQVIAPFGGFSLPVEDLSDLGEADREAAVRRRTGEEARRPFDFSAGPLFRAALLRLGEEDHVLLLSMHHVVSDGWSMDVLSRELSVLYEAYREGRESPLPELPVQYADDAVWQREQLTGEVLDRQLAYWRERLAGAPELLELPADHPRPQRQDYAGASVSLVLDEALTAGLRALGRRNGTTLFMTLLAGWSVVLSRLSGQEEVVIGTDAANRGRREIEGLIGYFSNTLALRVDLARRPTVAELMEQVKQRALEAQDNQDTPFEQVVERLQPARSLAHNPMFQVHFSWQNASGGGLELAGLKLERVPGVTAATAKFDLSLTLGEAGGRIVGGLSYATALYEAATVERHAAYLRRVLEEMVADDARPVDRLELLPRAERRLVVEEWNRTDRAFPAESCVHELFEAQAERTPDAIALVWGGQALSYRELDARAGRVAEQLARLGVRPEERVGVLLERGVEQVLATLAVLKAGGCCVPVDPGYPPERVALMLADAGARVVVSERGFPGARPVDGAAWATLWLDALEEPAGAPAGPRRRAVPRNLAYLFYTSGSTGRPKGVMMSHREVVQFAAGLGETMPLGPGHRVALASNVSFDAAVFELWGAWLHGAAVVGLDRDVLLSADALHDALRAQRITHLYQTAALFNQHVLARPDVYASLEQLVFGAEAVGTDGVRLMLAHGRPRRVLHEYGPTEATVWCTLERVESVAAGATTVPIGRPIPNARAYVLDPAGQPVPVGVAGELWIGGAGVVRGYLGRPGLTAERFVPDPFAAGPGARLYRTGDLARWRSDGKLEFLGRNDDQVKVRGFRVEPREIRARLLEHGAVRDAVVVVREDVPGDKRLVGYWVGDPVSPEALRAHLSERLPEYMVPGAYVRLEALPLTPNGKVDRRALPAPEGDAYATHGYEAPVGDTERALAEIWSEVLGVERVGREDDFFELGGHSLLIVRLISRIQQVMGAQVGIDLLFEYPVLKELAEALAEAGRAELPEIERVDRSAPLPLSYAQQRLWFLEQLGDLGSTYHVPRRMRLRGPLDRDALVRALDRLLARHEALRTTFSLRDGEPEQRIGPETTRFHLLEHDLAAEAEAPDALQRLITEEATASFDLERGPLIRGRLIRLGEDDHVLLLTMHHIVSDGWSMGVLVDELGRLYAAFREGRPDPLPALPVQYADYAAWQRRWVEDRVLETQASYWVRTLSGAPALLELPTDHPRPPRQDHAGARLPLELDETLTAGLKELGRRHGTTLFMTLLAGWAAVLGRLSGQREVVIGTPTANRGRREIEGLIGFFVNTLALRVDLSERPTVAELLGRVKTRALEAQQNQDIPFEQVVERVQPVRSLAHSPLFQVVFNWQNEARGGVELPGLELGPTPRAERTAAKFDLLLALRERGGQIEGKLEYATSLFERATVERFAGYLRTVLEQMAAGGARAVDRLELLGDAERARLLALGEGAAPELPRATVDALFAQAAAAAPQAVALAWDGGRMTYAELDARANRLARHLRRAGVAAGTRVGVCLERGPEMVVAMLAALRAGGAYVPLDPAYPAERLAFMLADTTVPVLVTESPLADRLPRHAARLVRMDTDAAAIAAEPADAFDAGTDPESVAYVMYTSGSTGRPKGVEVPHRAIVRLVRGQDYLSIDPSDVFLQLAPASFDAATLEVWGPLLNGARLALHPAGEPTVESIARALAEHGVTVLWLTAGLFHLVVEERIEILRGVRQLLAGGDVLSVPHVRRVLEELPETALINGYGPTENTTFTCCHRIAETPPEGASIPVGRPVANTYVRVLDAGMQPVPAGVPGELYAGGAGLALGYLNRPELTAEKFVPDPFATGARLYRTGDRVRWRADGTVEFLGRVDTQVKIRGFRVEPGEVEAVLRDSPGVREVAVMVREDAPGDRRLVAYVAGEVEADEVREHLRKRLPEHMLPGAIVRLDALPLTANGKLDRNALPAPEFASAEERYVAPRTPMEELLAGIWAEVLRLDRVGVEESFFDLGGHSLLAMRVVSRVREAFGVELPLRALFEGPTVAGLALQVERLVLARVEEPELADVLERLEQLSEDEVMELLSGD